MKFIIRSVRSKPAANDSNEFDEFDEFCESVLSVLDRSDFFQEPPPIAVERQSMRQDPSLIQLFSALCVT